MTSLGATQHQQILVSAQIAVCYTEEISKARYSAAVSLPVHILRVSIFHELRV